MLVLSLTRSSIIALPGLGGHAFVTWQGTTIEHWLRDFLPEDLADLAGCRVWAYGYNSRLDEHRSVAGLFEYANRFRQELMVLASRHKV